MADDFGSPEFFAAMHQTINVAFAIAGYAPIFLAGVVLHLACLMGAVYAQGAFQYGDRNLVFKEDLEDRGSIVVLLAGSLVIVNCMSAAFFQCTPYWAAVLLTWLGCWIVIGLLVIAGVLVYIVVATLIWLLKKIRAERTEQKEKKGNQ